MQFGSVTQLSSAHSTGGAVVPIRVPTPITTITRSSIHFIDKPQKKPPFRGELISAITWCAWRAVVDYLVSEPSLDAIEIAKEGPQIHWGAGGR